MFRTTALATVLAFAASTTLAQVTNITIEELETQFPTNEVIDDGTITLFVGENDEGGEIRALFDSETGTLLSVNGEPFVEDTTGDGEETTDGEDEGEADGPAPTTGELRRRGGEEHPGRHLGNDGIENHPIFGDQDRPGRNRGSDDDSDDDSDGGSDDSGASNSSNGGGNGNNGNGNGNGNGRNK